jgi:hypothetical protein
MRFATTAPRRFGPGKTAALAAAVGLGLAATVVALPSVASADSRTQTYDIWNLTSTALNITGYENAKEPAATTSERWPMRRVRPSMSPSPIRTSRPS